MPTYHYRCKNCNYDFTEQQSFTDDPITVCPECGEEQVRKVYSAVPIEFKGSGFYRTDKSKLPTGAESNATRRRLWITPILRPQPRIPLAVVITIRSSCMHDDLFSFLDGPPATFEFAHIDGLGRTDRAHDASATRPSWFDCRIVGSQTKQRTPASVPRRIVRWPDGIRHAAMRTRSHRHAAYCGRGAECRQRHGHHTRRRGVT